MDISGILKDWEYDPDNTIRIVTLEDEREVIQIRQPLGIEQYELNGRPDGQRPFQKESVLDEFLDRLDYYKILRSSDENFVITHDEFKQLQEEAILFYFRYILMYQIGDYEKLERDTAHNLKICEIVERYVENEKDKVEILQYRPYMLKMNAIAKAMIQIQKKFKGVARDILRSAIDLIKNIPEIDTPAFKMEKTRSIETLSMTLKELSGSDQSIVDKLQKELEEAVEVEAYERAAVLRDQIQTLRNQ